MKTKAFYVHKRHIQKTVTVMTGVGCWFEVDPYPDNLWRIDFKPEWERTVRKHLSLYAGIPFSFFDGEA